MRSGFLGRCERSAGSGPLLQCERRSGLSRLSGAVPHVRDQPCVQRFLAGGDLRSLGGCSAVTHSAGLTLQRPLSMAKIINTDAGRLPLLAQHPAHPEILISQGPIPRRPARLPKEVRSSASSVQLQERSQLGKCGSVRGTALRGRNPTQLVWGVKETVRRGDFEFGECRSGTIPNLWFSPVANSAKS